ncbi:hypothetical protein Scep_023938 [Stephania cephalantha]|uniref:Uncharacterized protein n=1 Tax=Stephania cephalantha TaxID=152367 RepID=A0AAP0F2P8_9MAGN
MLQNDKVRRRDRSEIARVRETRSEASAPVRSVKARRTPKRNCYGLSGSIGKRVMVTVYLRYERVRTGGRGLVLNPRSFMVVRRYYPGPWMVHSRPSILSGSMDVS